MHHVYTFVASRVPDWVQGAAGDASNAQPERQTRSLNLKPYTLIKGPEKSGLGQYTIQKLTL